MKPTRVLVLGLIGILLAAAFAMGALAVVREGLDEPSDVDDFPALVPSEVTSPATPSAGTIGTPQDDEDQETGSPSTSPSPTRTAGASDDRTDGDGDREGPGDDD